MVNEKFRIKGGTPLRGAVRIRGSKNAATKMMVASLLTREPCILENMPRSAEVDITEELCAHIGSEVVWEDFHRCRITTQKVGTSVVPQLSRRNRIPVLALGPLLHRNGMAEIPVLGGCPIGHRPINFHIEALKKMGVEVDRRENSYLARAKRIRGAEIEFPFPSVGATENVLLAATLAEGKTVIRNAAIEPEIVNLIDMLCMMGARIQVDVLARVISVDGVSSLHGVTARVIPDRNEVISFASAALGTGGDVLIQDVESAHIRMFLEKIEELGGKYQVQDGGIRFWGVPPYQHTAVTTAPHPAFMTDWQQPFCVLLTQAKGESIIHETVYEDRLWYVKELGRMGARIEVSAQCLGETTCRFSGGGLYHSARIFGPTILHGSEITMKDIRAGMAYIIAALMAEGESIISGINHIERGYEKIDERLRGLGADIKRV